MLNLGFVGAGGIARHHAIRLKQIRSARIIAVADIDEGAARSFAADNRRDRDIAVCVDHRQLVKRDDVDAVYVCTRTYQHATPVIAAARAGKHVFCEKPMALKLGDAKRMAEACKKAGVALTIGFVRRFDREWGAMKKVVDSGTLGHPLIWRFSSATFQARVWYRDVDKGGGPLIDAAVHNYDFALQMFGPVSSVQASSNQLAPDSVGADGGSAILTFDSGHQHTLIWTWGAARDVPFAGLNDIVGPAGWVRFGDRAVEKPASFDPAKHGALTVTGGDGSERLVTYLRRDMFADQATHVIKCFARNQQPLVTGSDGIAALKVALAVLKSGRTRRTVKP